MTVIRFLFVLLLLQNLVNAADQGLYDGTLVPRLIAKAVEEGEVILRCEADHFDVLVPTSRLPGDAEPNDLYLEFDSSCRGQPYGDEPYILIRSKYDECGTRKDTEGNGNIYSNRVVNDPGDELIEYLAVHYTLECEFDLSGIVTTNINTTGDVVHKEARVNVTYDFIVSEYKDFSVPYDGHPVRTNKEMYFRVELVSDGLEDRKLFLKKCSAQPNEVVANETKKYTFIEDGCVVGNADAEVLDSGDNHEADFELTTFLFVQDHETLHSMIWITCEVELCTLDDDTCDLNCPLLVPSRRRRSIGLQTKEKIARKVLQGPISLI